jgi:hypothetical protein
MKFIILLSLMFGSHFAQADDPSTQEQIEKIKAQLKVLGDQQSEKSPGLKVKDYKNSEIKTTATDTEQKISPEDQKKLEDALKKGKKYIEERNKYLEELENE